MIIDRPSAGVDWRLRLAEASRIEGARPFYVRARNAAPSRTQRYSVIKIIEENCDAVRQGAPQFHIHRRALTIVVDAGGGFARGRGVAQAIEKHLHAGAVDHEGQAHKKHIGLRRSPR
jgi:hypothetical protein